MIQLRDIPFVLPIAIWVWGIGSSKEDDANANNISADICLTGINFIVNQSCFSQLIAKGIGICIIIASCINKTPIMKNIIQTNSSLGISRFSLYGELVMYCNGASYSFLLNHPFTAYGENITLLIQTFILVLMSWKYSSPNKKIQFIEYITFIVVSIMYIIYVFYLLPYSNLHYLIQSIWPISIYSRGTQIIETFQLKHTGSLAILTTTLNCVGNFIRILTTMKETNNDFTLIASYCLGLLLNIIMFIQYWYYLQNTNKYKKELILKEVAATTAAAVNTNTKNVVAATKKDGGKSKSE